MESENSSDELTDSSDDSEEERKRNMSQTSDYLSDSMETNSESDNDCAFGGSEREETDKTLAEKMELMCSGKMGQSKKRKHSGSDDDEFK